MTVTIYHNPRCSKSRATLAILQENGVEPTIVEYLENPPSVDELKAVLGKLGMAPKELLRKKEAKEEGVDPDQDADALIEAMVAHPRVIERPVVVNGDKAKVGRPPEGVVEIL